MVTIYWTHNSTVFAFFPSADCWSAHQKEEMQMLPLERFLKVKTTFEGCRPPGNPTESDECCFLTKCLIAYHRDFKILSI